MTSQSYLYDKILETFSYFPQVNLVMMVKTVGSLSHMKAAGERKSHKPKNTEKSTEKSRQTWTDDLYTQRSKGSVFIKIHSFFMGL